MSKPEYDKLVEAVACKMQGSVESLGSYRETAQAVLALIHERLRTPTDAIVEAWETATWLPEGAKISDFSDEEANRLASTSDLRALLDKSALTSGDQS